MSLRDLTAKLVAPALLRTGYRFPKEYRWGITRMHRIVNALVNTTRANNIANGWIPR